MKLLLAFVLTVILFSVGLAQDMAVGRVRLQSNTVHSSDGGQVTTFAGDVVAVGDNYTLAADAVDVHFTENNRIERIVCRDNVNFKTDDILAVSDYAELDQRTKLITLKGTSRIWQKENYLEGDYMEIQYETREVYVNKGNMEQVTVIFNLEGQN